MKRLRRFIAIYTIMLTLPFALSGCFNKAPVCHIASDISLIIPNQTKQEEILSYLGIPAKKRTISDEEEEWLYFQPYDSFMRKMPYVGKKIGDCEYDMAIIRFKNEIVTSSQYRDLSEAEFKQLGIPESAPK